MKKVASVPYAVGEAYDFYDDRLIIDGTEILYHEILGYGYLLTHKSTSINLIPAANSTSFNVTLVLNDGQKFKFGRHAGSVMYFKTEKQRTVDLIFSEVIKCIEVLVAPNVYEKLINYLAQDGASIQIGKLIITKQGLTYKRNWGKKYLYPDEYYGADITQGQVHVWGVDRRKGSKKFFSCTLSYINAPLLPYILNTLFGQEV